MNRKPLAFVNGEIAEMPSGDLVDPAVLPAQPAVIDPSLVTRPNGQGVDRPFGTPVYIKSNGDFAEAVPEDAEKAEAIGLLTENVANNAPGVIKTSGVLEGTQAQWNAQTGLTGGLVAGSDYYLRGTGGLSTSAVGPHVTKIGKAITAELLLIRVEPTLSLS